MLNYKGECIDEFVEKNYPLFIWIINRYNRENYYTTSQDLIDYSLTTYLSCCQKFDMEKNIKFSSFLTKSIQNRINHYYSRSKDYKIKTNESMSLNSDVINDEQMEFVELVQYEFDKFSAQNNHVLLNEVIEYLKSNFTSRDLEIFYLYINDNNQRSIAKRYDISQAQVSRIIKNIRSKTKNYFGFSN